jgi:hypothetical protein
MILRRARVVLFPPPAAQRAARGRAVDAPQLAIDLAGVHAVNLEMSLPLVERAVGACCSRIASSAGEPRDGRGSSNRSGIGKPTRSARVRVSFHPGPNEAHKCPRGVGPARYCAGAPLGQGKQFHVRDSNSPVA